MIAFSEKLLNGKEREGGWGVDEGEGQGQEEGAEGISRKTKKHEKDKDKDKDKDKLEITLMKGAPASFASRRATSVFPTPVGPIIRIFLGITSSLRGGWSFMRRHLLVFIY